MVQYHRELVNSSGHDGRESVNCRLNAGDGNELVNAELGDHLRAQIAKSLRQRVRAPERPFDGDLLIELHGDEKSKRVAIDEVVGFGQTGWAQGHRHVSTSRRATVHNAMTIVVFTDGACSGNPGPGGWGWVVAPDGTPSGSGGEAVSTNQRMELMAVLEALRSFPTDNIEIVSDSTYVVNCFKDRWWAGWLKKGWKNSQNKPVANRDIWEPLIDLYRSRADQISFRWVKGHSGNRMNDLVDELAVTASKGPFGPAPAPKSPTDRLF